MFDSSDSIDSTVLPPAIHFKSFTDARAAVERLVEIYARNTAFIRAEFAKYAKGDSSVKLRVRAYYPAIRIKVNTYQEVDSRLSSGHLVEPGGYMTTVTQPALRSDAHTPELKSLMRLSSAVFS